MDNTASAGGRRRNHRRGIVVKLVMVRQREGAEWVIMLVPQPIQLMQRNDRRRRRLRASNVEWEIGGSGFKTAVPVNVLSCGQTDDGGPLSGSA